MSPESQTPANIALASPATFWIAIQALRLHHWVKNSAFVRACYHRACFDPVSSVEPLYCLHCFWLHGIGSLFDQRFSRDTEHDRQDPDPAKRKRPQVTGQLSSHTAFVLAMTLIAIAMVCALWLTTSFQLILTAYLFISLAYSFLLKRAPLIDIMTLTILLDLRLEAGASVVMMPLPSTLLLACTCFFFTLALLKRMAQVSALKVPLGRLPGRPYGREYLLALRVLAGAAGAASVLASAIFLHTIGTHVARPSILWFVLLLQMAWLRRCFFLCTRGELNEDLLLFVLSDRYSYILLSVLALLLIAAG